MNTTLSTVAALFVSAAVALAETASLASVVQQGIFEEEVNRDFQAAVKAYEEAVAQYDRERRFAGAALFRLAENYGRAGRTEEAEALYQRLVREFHDQAELAETAAGRLPESALAVTERGIADEETRMIEELKELIRNSPDLLHARTEGNNTRLHDAIVRGHLRVARFLIDRGLDLEATNRRGDRPLHLAVESGSLSAVELLLENGADLLARGYGETPLHTAAGNGFLAIARLLLDRSADVNATDPRGATPLHCAIGGSHLHITRLLLERNADVNATTENGVTALHIAARIPNVELARLLLDRGAEPDVPAQSGESPLHTAAKHANARVVVLLLEHGADINATAEDGGTALHIAARLSHADLARLLLDRGAEPNVPAESGESPLHTAVKHGSARVVALLLEHGADVNALTELGESPLDYLISRDDLRPEEARKISDALHRHGAAEGKFHARIALQDGKEFVVLWDRAESMTVSRALAQAGLTMEDLERAEASPASVERARRAAVAEALNRQHAAEASPAESARMAALAEEIRRRREIRRALEHEKDYVFAREAAAILRGEREDIVLRNGSMIDLR